MRNFVIFTLILLGLTVSVPNADAQTPEPAGRPTLTVSGYVDAYFGYSNDSSAAVGGIERFQSLSLRHRQAGLNLARIAGTYASDNLRANVALFWGDLPAFSWQGNVHEANIGLRIVNNLWFDIGYFSAHVGTESLLPKDNITALYAIGTQHEPFFHSGAKLSYENERLTAMLMLNNGYYSFTRQKPNLSIGALITYGFSDRLSIGYSNQTGNEWAQNNPADIYSLRVYNNLWLSYVADKFEILVGADFGMQAKAALGDTVRLDTTGAILRRDETAGMASALAAFRFRINNRFAVYGKGEFMRDPNAILTPSQLMTTAFGAEASPDVKRMNRGLTAIGFTLGIQVTPAPNAYVRLEGQYLNALNQQGPFFSNRENRSARVMGLVTAGVSFDSTNLIR